jgi:hypothetical protein
MLNGDAHHSRTCEIELRIWPLPSFQRLERAHDSRVRVIFSSYAFTPNPLRRV